MDISKLCRKVSAEGSVLLKNDNDLLPFKKGSKIAVFGRAQTFYYKSGTGSGGLVHIKKEPCIIESLKRNDSLVLDKELIGIYQNWIKDNPFNDGGGVWAGEPWFQEEMPIDEDIVKSASERNDAAVIVISRTAGEDHDNADEEGSYRLTVKEELLLNKVTKHFKDVVVALNVGNIIDLSFLNKYQISSLLFIWQGGEEGANAFSNVLSGDLVPSGKLTDTIAFNISDYPSNANFGDRNKNFYKEDIYVGYRYFETFAKNKVMYPFGFGLTYTKFDTKYSAKEEDGIITITADVTNVGKIASKEVVQVYFEAPCNELGNPSRQLIALKKTKELKPNETEILTLKFNVCDMASFDDIGVIGERSSYVLDKGDYEIYVGTDVRSANYIFTYAVDNLTVVKQLESIMSPVEEFERLCADGKYRTVPLNNFDLENRVAEQRPNEISFSGDKGIKLKDVFYNRNTLDEFISQLTDDDLAALCCGEGMNSTKATPGTGGALGGQTESLSNFGIPVCCVTDGPSGIRLDDGKIAILIPNGTALASTWDTDMVESIYSYIGEELKNYCVDALLGPGINIHRHPLCGRNFEYFSEDPYLTGSIAVAVTKGIAKSNSYSTIKHFCCNNQETNRYDCETVVSERALREIYLKPFEMAVKNGKNVLIMTAYNPVNGYWTASNYYLTHTILRKEWKFDNLVMTDWWAKCNLKCKSAGEKELLQAMIRAENDVYMVCDDANTKAQSILDGLNQGYITRSELQRCVKNICGWIIKTNTFKEYLKNDCLPKYPITIDDKNMNNKSIIERPKVETVYCVELSKGIVALEFSVCCNTDALAQNPIIVKMNNLNFTFSVCGTADNYVKIKRNITLEKNGIYQISVKHSDVVNIKKIRIRQ